MQVLQNVNKVNYQFFEKQKSRIRKAGVGGGPGEALVKSARGGGKLNCASRSYLRQRAARNQRSALGAAGESEKSELIKSSSKPASARSFLIERSV